MFDGMASYSHGPSRDSLLGREERDATLWAGDEDVRTEMRTDARSASSRRSPRTPRALASFSKYCSASTTCEIEFPIQDPRRILPSDER